MNNSRLISILKEFSTRERTKFKEYVESPFFNKNKKVRTLCQHLLKFAPKFDDVDLEKERVYPVVFGKGKKYKESQLLNVISDLLQLLYGYLSYKNFNDNGRQAQICLLDELQKREMYGPFDSLGKKFRKQGKKITIHDAEFFLEEYQFYHQLDIQFHSKASRFYDENLQVKSDQLDLYYLVSKLKIACDMTSRNIVIQADYECRHLEDLITRIEEDASLYQKKPAIHIYYCIFQTLRESENEAHYLLLKKLLSENIDKFDKVESRTMFDYLQNYCIRKINIGKSEYYKELMDSYKLTLQTEIAFYKGHLPEWDYKNIVTVGLRLEDYDWIEGFIYKYKDKMQEEVRENAFRYNLASYYYAIKKYREALRNLLTIEHKDTSYTLGARTIQLKSYYELDEYEAFLAHIDAFKIYLRRSGQISEYRKKANANLLKISKSLYQIRQEREFDGKEKFQKRLAEMKDLLENTSPVANIDWLWQVLEELK